METTILTELIKTSPALAVMLMLFYLQRKDSEKRSEDYKLFVNKVQDENLSREKNMQETIHKNQEVISKNQEIIHDLTNKLDVVFEVQKDVEDIKDEIKDLKK